MKMKYVLLAVVLLVFAAGSIAFWQYQKPARNLTRETADLTISASELLQKFTGNEAEANKLYLDKIIQVKGVLKAVSRGADGSLSLSLEAGSEMSGITCEVPAANIPEGLNLQTGREITIKGQCTGFLMDVVLVKCVILP